MGLVDQLVDPASLEAVAVEAAASLANGSLKPKRKAKALMNKMIEDNSLGRSIMWKKVGLGRSCSVGHSCSLQIEGLRDFYSSVVLPFQPSTALHVE